MARHNPRLVAKRKSDLFQYQYAPGLTNCAKKKTAYNNICKLLVIYGAGEPYHVISTVDFKKLKQRYHGFQINFPLQ